MATNRYLDCGKCGPTLITISLFEALLDHARHGPPTCPRCHQAAGLRLKFAFGLNAPDSDCTVQECFVPTEPQSWKDAGGNTVTFYPFLVLVHRHGRKIAAWLPYWHLVEYGRKTKMKYGQWAPFMDEHLFIDLITQAREKGYCVPSPQGA